MKLLTKHVPKIFPKCKIYNVQRTLLTKSEAQINQEKPKRIFSGIQPTGTIHLGNYLGAVKQWINFQNEEKDVILEIADLHSITLPQNPQTLSYSILEMAATLIACGIDPNKVILFQQSKVSTHAELCWLLGCICTMARLSHLPTFKEKSASLKEIPLGLFVYPILQAADILGYKATHVPVGEDQAQHIQLAQDLASMFNKRYGYCFPIPKSIIADCARLKSLRDPAKKMSKSDPDPKSRICLLDKPDDIASKIKKAVTDFTSEVTFDLKERPGVSNLISIHSNFTGKSVDDICKEAKGLNTGEYKKVVAEVIIQHLVPIRQEVEKLLDDKPYLINILDNGAEKAAEISSKTLNQVKRQLGLVCDFNLQIEQRNLVNKV